MRWRDLGRCGQVILGHAGPVALILCGRCFIICLTVRASWQGGGSFEPAEVPGVARSAECVAPAGMAVTLLVAVRFLPPVSPIRGSGSINTSAAVGEVQEGPMGGMDVAVVAGMVIPGPSLPLGMGVCGWPCGGIRGPQSMVFFCMADVQSPFAIHGCMILESSCERDYLAQPQPSRCKFVADLGRTDRDEYLIYLETWVG